MADLSVNQKLLNFRWLGPDLTLNLPNAPWLSNVLKIEALTTPNNAGANAVSTYSGSANGQTPGGTLTKLVQGGNYKLNSGTYNGWALPTAVLLNLPTISSIFPLTVAPGDTLNITGTFLLTAKYVLIGGMSAAIASGTTNTNVSATVPLTAPNGSNIPVVVITEVGAAVVLTLTVATPTPKLASPVLGQADNITSTGFRQSWGAVPNATGYQVRLGGAGGTLYMPGNATSYTFSRLVAGSQQIVDVQALDSTNAYQASDYSATNTVTLPTTNPNVPQFDAFSATPVQAGVPHTFTGSKFTGVTEFAINGVAPYSFNVVDDNHISALLLNRQSTGLVTAKNAAGYGTSNGALPITQDTSGLVQQLVVAGDSLQEGGHTTNPPLTSVGGRMVAKARAASGVTATILDPIIVARGGSASSEMAGAQWDNFITKVNAVGLSNIGQFIFDIGSYVNDVMVLASDEPAVKTHYNEFEAKFRKFCADNNKPAKFLMDIPPANRNTSNYPNGTSIPTYDGLRLSRSDERILNYNVPVAAGGYGADHIAVYEPTKRLIQDPSDQRVYRDDQLHFGDLGQDQRADVRMPGFIAAINGSAATVPPPMPAVLTNSATITGGGTGFAVNFDARSGVTHRGEIITKWANPALNDYLQEISVAGVQLTSPHFVTENGISFIEMRNSQMNGQVVLPISGSQQFLFTAVIRVPKEVDGSFLNRTLLGLGTPNGGNSSTATLAIFNQKLCMIYSNGDFSDGTGFTMIGDQFVFVAGGRNAAGVTFVQLKNMLSTGQTLRNDGSLPATVMQVGQSSAYPIGNSPFDIAAVRTYQTYDPATITADLNYFTTAFGLV